MTLMRIRYVPGSHVRRYRRSRCFLHGALDLLKAEFQVSTHGPEGGTIGRALSDICAGGKG